MAYTVFSILVIVNMIFWQNKFVLELDNKNIIWSY